MKIKNGLIFLIIYLVFSQLAIAQTKKIFPDGSTYVGEWKNDKFNGQGTYTSYSGLIYAGEWKDNKRNGQGTLTFPSGSTYVGKFKDDLMNGQGTMTFLDGTICVGQWKDGKQNGHGTFTSLDGENYVGEFKDNKRNGKGTLTFPSGSTYVGSFKEDVMNGKGTMTFPDGTICVGQWIDGKQNGQDAFTERESIQPIKNALPRVTLLKGFVIDKETKEPIFADIDLYDLKNNELLASFESNELTGKFLLSLPSGKNYSVNVKAKGYLFHSQNYNLPDSNEYQEIEQTIELKKIEVGKEK